MCIFFIFSNSVDLRIVHILVFQLPKEPQTPTPKKQFSSVVLLEVCTACCPGRTWCEYLLAGQKSRSAVLECLKAKDHMCWILVFLLWFDSFCHFHGTLVPSTELCYEWFDCKLMQVVGNKIPCKNVCKYSSFLLHMVCNPAEGVKASAEVVVCSTILLWIE